MEVKTLLLELGTWYIQRPHAQRSVSTRETGETQVLVPLLDPEHDPNRFPVEGLN